MTGRQSFHKALKTYEAWHNGELTDFVKLQENIGVRLAVPAPDMPVYEMAHALLSGDFKYEENPYVQRMMNGESPKHILDDVLSQRKHSLRFPWNRNKRDEFNWGVIEPLVSVAPAADSLKQRILLHPSNIESAALYGIGAGFATAPFIEDFTAGLVGALTTFLSHSFIGGNLSEARTKVQNQLQYIKSFLPVNKGETKE